MNLRQVYVDFQDGDGFVNISHLVKYETLNINLIAFNDQYRAGQNSCSFSVIYDATIFPKLRYMANDIIVRIVDLKENACITTEDDWFITTENSFFICTETDLAVPIFYGHIPVTRRRKYNGILDNTIVQLEAIDDLDWMDVPVGDVIYSNCAVYNPADPANSITHRLALIAGWTSVMFNTDVFILDTIARFAPKKEDDTVRKVLDTLLHEYGYVLNLDERGYISPIQWDIDAGSTYSFEFNENNIIMELETADKNRSYDAVEITHYELNVAEKIRVFTDSNCGFADNGLFQGYVVPNGYFYPPEANVIDESTGTNQIVYQEYSDDAIKYWTNKAIKENLDFNYKAFDSDFSGIVATENHFLDNRIEAGLTFVSSSFGNTKARVLYQNTSGSSKRIYFNNIYADVWYTSAERTIDIDIVAEPSRIAKITLNFVYDADVARAYARAIAKQYEVGLVEYVASCESDRPIGETVRVVAGDGTDQMCLIRQKDWDETKEYFKYTLTPVSEDRGDITRQNVSQTIYVTPTSPFTSSTTTGQLTIPYNGTTPDFTNVWVEMNIQQAGIDVTEDWIFSAVPTGCTGAYDSVIKNRYKITGISVANASVILKANRGNWQEQSQLVTVVKSIGEKGDPGTGVQLKGRVTDYTYLPTTGVTVGDTYIIENTGGGYNAGDGATAISIGPVVWQNVGPIQGPQGDPGSPGADGADGDNARYVTLALSAGGVIFNTAGANPSPNNVDLTATPYQFTGTPYYQFFDNGVSLGAPSTTAVKNLSLAGRTFSQFPRRIEVEVREGSASNPVVAKDFVSLVGIMAGASGVVPIVSNESHVFPASIDGVVTSYVGSGTDIQIFEGSTALTYHTVLASGRFIIGTRTVFPVGAITPGSITGSGTNKAVVGQHSGASNAQDVITITYPITARRADGTDISFSIVQTLTKGKQGAQGSQHIGIGVPVSSSDPNIALFTVSSTPSFVSAGTRVAGINDTVFVRHFQGETADNRKALYKWTGSVWTNTTITNADRSLAAMDLMNVCKIYGTPTTGDAYQWFNSLVANQAFIDFLSVNSLEFTNSLASASATTKQVGDYRVSMGRNIDDTFSLLFQNLLALTSGQESWVDTFRVSGGLNNTHLYLNGDIDATGVVRSGLGKKWIQSSSTLWNVTSTLNTVGAAYGNGYLYLFRSNGSTLFVIRSSDLGITLDAGSVTSASVSGGVRGVAFGNGYFVVAVGNSLYRTTGTSTPTLVYTDTSPIGGVRWTGTYFVASGCFFSTNGSTWTSRKATLGTFPSTWWCVKSNNEILIDWGGGGYRIHNILLNSTTTISTVQTSVDGIGYSNGILLRNYRTSVGATPTIQRSVDFGKTWATVSGAPTVELAQFYTRNNVIILSDLCLYAYYSVDYGQTWTELPSNGSIFDEVDPFVYINTGDKERLGILTQWTNPSVGSACWRFSYTDSFQLNTIVDSGTSVDGKSNYTLFSDGTLQCWGNNIGVSGSFCLITFPYAFADSTYGVGATAAGGSTGVDLSVGARPNIPEGYRTNTSMRVYINEGSTQFAERFTWTAIGRAAT